MNRILAGVAFAAIASTAAAADLRICVEGAYPPFSMLDDSGAVVGFDIDIANAVCAKMGKSCQMVATEWDAIIPALEEKKCDAIIASMSITPERRQRIDFSEKYYNTPARLVAVEGVDWRGTPEGLADKQVCVQRGTIHQDFMEGVFPNVSLSLYPTQEEANMDLVSGRCDALMADSITLDDGFLKTEAGKGFAFFGPEFSDPKYHGDGAGVGIRKGEEDLRDAFSAAIKELRKDGTYKRINDKYFDFDIYGG